MIAQIGLVFVLTLWPMLGRADSPLDFSEIILQTSPAVVVVKTYQNIDNGLPADIEAQLPDKLLPLFEAAERGDSPRSMGSGFFVTDRGHILTSRHLLQNADKIIAKTIDGQTYSARLLGSDAVSDLAILKIEGGPFKRLSLSEYDQVRAGTWVLAVGHPFGFEFSSTTGIVSATERIIVSSPGAGEVGYIQTNLAINPGHSGGPLFNAMGKVVGVNTLIFSDHASSIGLAFAVPASVAQFVTDQLIATGRVVRVEVGH